MGVTMTTFTLSDDMKCEYKLTINDAKSVILEVQGYNSVCRFIHRLNFYKRLTEPSSEDRIGVGKEISYATISLDKLKKSGKDYYSLIIPCDVKDVLDALKFTKTIDEKSYKKIYDSYANEFKHRFPQPL